MSVSVKLQSLGATSRAVLPQLRTPLQVGTVFYGHLEIGPFKSYYLELFLSPVSDEWSVTW